MDTQTPHPFKGNVDLEKLESYIRERYVEIVYEPRVLRHFTAALKPVEQHDGPIIT